MKNFSVLTCTLLLGFLLGIHDGRIALWKDNNPEPLKVFPYSAYLLPPADRRALEEGIRFENLDELKRMVEDYLS